MTGIDAHISSAHMVLSRDLNPHDTLFAGQGTSYMIECAFLAVQSFLRTPHIVCLGLDGLRFLHPVHKGDTIRVDSSIVYAGTSGVGVYITLSLLPDGPVAASCFVSFVHIEEATGRAVPHGVTLPELPDELSARQKQYLAYKEMTRR